MHKRLVHLSWFPGSILLSAFIPAAGAPAVPAPSGGEGILMFHIDAARTGWSSGERTLAHTWRAGHEVVAFGLK